MSFDGIKKEFKNPHLRLQRLKRQVLDMRVERKPKKVFVRIASIDIREVVSRSENPFTKYLRAIAGNFSLRYSIAFVSVGCMLVAFVAGMWVSTNTPKGLADNMASAAQADAASGGPAIVASFGTVPSGTEISTLSNDILFNTPIENLQSYLNPPPKPDVLAERKTKIKDFLTEYNSPLSAAADTIAEQPHWKLILAIAFAESTLGKNCVDNNCSNIGVKPGNPIWHQYKSYDDWVLDFNKLLERRYKDKTLKQMCGVYVQPCNPNWLLATQQILDALETQRIQ